MNKGLSTEQAKTNLKTFGFNELPISKSKNVFQIALEVFKQPLFILLLSCGSLYLLLGDYTEGIVLLCSVFVIIFITFYQNQKTEKALEALKRFSSPKALVIREGKELKIESREVVPEDLIIVNEGDRIPADGFLIESNNIYVDESMLTGESVPVLKSDKQENEEKSNIFSGTLVVQGRGIFKVTQTGINTEFGKIGKSLQNIEETETR